MTYTKLIKLTNDELFIIMGLVTMNSKIVDQFVTAFSKYDREKYTLDITVPEVLVDELVRICKLHKNQTGTVEKVFNKILMSKELIVIDTEYDKKIKMVETKFKGKIINLH